MSNVIYAYRKKSLNKIVYIGQTVDLETRHKQHIKYDPYNPNAKEYNYPLSRGIRKYGSNEYELIILEDNIKKEDLDNREQYWISYYDTYWHGYNQTLGGSAPNKPIFNEDKIDDVITMLQDESYSYQDIIDKTGISLTHIYNINIGARRKRNNITYPIRESRTVGTKGLKLSQTECKEIHSLLQNTSLSFKDIGNKYNIARETVSDINAGKTKSYILEGWTYPIRAKELCKATGKTLLNQQQIEEIWSLLMDSNYTFEQIGKKFGVGISTISNINNGKTKSYHSDIIQYPIRH